jgi:hypothetical protein
MMMQTVVVAEMLMAFNELTRLIPQEDLLNVMVEWLTLLVWEVPGSILGPGNWLS